MFISGIENCPHFYKNSFIDYKTLQFFSINDIFDNNDEEDNPSMKLANLLFTDKIQEDKKPDKFNFNFESIFQKSIIDNNSEKLNNTKDNI